MKEVQIIGTGSYAPENIVSNEDLSRIVETSDEWITTRTGIKERRISEGENTSDIATKAALRAIEDAKIAVEDIEMIIVGTITPDYYTPSTACIVQKNIGAGNATCFDISAACSGYQYSMAVAAQFIKTGQIKTALVIGAEILSKIINWEDRTTCVIFADGAGAAVLREGTESGVLSLYTGSDGSKGESLTVPAIGVKSPFAKVKEEKPSVINMDGKEIFRFATKVVVESIEKVLADGRVQLDEIKYIVPHQANIRIIEHVAKKLKIEEDKFYINIDRYGNTSGGSIGIALDEMAKKGMLAKGDKIILVGFGGGLTWGATLIQWTKE